MNYPNLPKDCTSLLCKYLTPQIFEELKDKKTNFNFTLEKAINSGVENLDSGIGVYAGDEESYELFSKLFDPIIEDYHGYSKEQSHKSNMSTDELNVDNPDKEDNYIISTRIRVGRNLKDFPLGTAISRESRLKVESLIAEALSTLDGELKGNYYPLLGMSEDIQNQLIEDHFLFKEGDRFLESAGLNRDWSEGRGIYHNANKTFLVWVNEEDQLRII